MADIEEAKGIVIEFLQKALDIKDVKVIGATKIDNQWHIEAEVYEENSFLKSLGLPTKVQDRNIYEVRLSDNLEVESYERQGHTLATN
jgi:alcohol dehydrogenase YqhD (iron-dependent ADH family)